MDDVLKVYWDLRQEVLDTSRELERHFSSTESSLQIQFFSMMFNEITCTIEMLDSYQIKWKSAVHTNCATTEDARKQNEQRVILIQRSGFINTISALEFCLRKIHENYPYVLGRMPSFTIKNLMERSVEKSYVSDANKVLWTGVYDLRNCIVHNNSHGFKTATHIYPDVRLRMNKDVMTQGGLLTFAYLSRWVLSATKEWMLAAVPK